MQKKVYLCSKILNFYESSRAFGRLAARDESAGFGCVRSTGK